MKPTRLFRGPLFPGKSGNIKVTLTGSPVAHGNIDSEDFTNRKAGRPTRKDLEAQRKRKEGKED